MRPLPAHDTRRGLAPSVQRLRAGWQILSARQRALATSAATLVIGALAWQVALGPALTTLRTAAAQREAQDAQLQSIRLLQAQATALRSAMQQLPALNREEARRALEAAVKSHFGDAARLTVSAEGATLTLTGVSGDALAPWLAQARIEARAVPGQARLTRQANGLWDGQMVLTLPSR